MKQLLALVALSAGIPVLAATYTVKAGSSSSTIQAIVNTAGAAPGNTVMFSAGAYSLATTIALPCSNGTIYTGPATGPQIIAYSSSGAMTIGNLPAAVFTLTSNSYVFSVNSNQGSFTSPTAGCTIQYMGFNGTQGGILVYPPSSGMTMQYNAFYNNNPDWNGAYPAANAAIYLDGVNGGSTPSEGASYISILWNTFFKNCASIQANAWPDAGGTCNAVHVQSYNNHITINNNVVNQTEEGFKFYEQSYPYAVEFNTDVENNNLQGNSRIAIEDQQPTNGNVIFSHNAFYQPTNPSFNSFELSLPLNECVTAACSSQGVGSAATTENDNVYIGNVPITIIGSGAHYGIGLEQWGVGSTANYSLFQGGNEPDTCDAGYDCSGWEVTVGESISNVSDTHNYFSGYDVAQSGAFAYEAGASSSNAGMVLNSNTVVGTSATIPVTVPSITTVTGSSSSTVTLKDADTNHRLTLFYTTDGTTPAIFAPGGSAGTTRVYGAPFTAAAGATVRAIASWGQGANQGIVFPSFGYVPSAVTSLVIAAGAQPPAVARTLVGAYLIPRVNTNTMTQGSTLQFKAMGNYSDGSVGSLPDAEGNAAVVWTSSNHAMAKISTQGHVTAVGTGKVDIQAVITGVRSSPFTLTINSPPSASPAAAVPAAAARESAALPAAASESAATPAAAAESPASPTAAPATAAPGNPASPVSGTAAGPIPTAPGRPQPDGFEGPFWRLETPAGGTASISNAHVFLGVPGGSNHDASGSSNQAVRVVQTIGNRDFDVSIKIDSPLFATDANTSQGLMVESDSADFTTFALVTDGSKVGLSAHMVTHGAATTLLNDSDFSQYQNPMYLRLTRSGSAYVALYSLDGVSWTQAASFTDTRIPTAIGPFAGNYNDTAANTIPVVMSVNWFDVQQ